jgi:hypothetical protein
VAGCFLYRMGVACIAFDDSDILYGQERRTSSRVSEGEKGFSQSVGQSGVELSFRHRSRSRLFSAFNSSSRLHHGYSSLVPDAPPTRTTCQNVYRGCVSLSLPLSAVVVVEGRRAPTSSCLGEPLVGSLPPREARRASQIQLPDPTIRSHASRA